MCLEKRIMNPMWNVIYLGYLICHDELLHFLIILAVGIHIHHHLRKPPTIMFIMRQPTYFLWTLILQRRRLFLSLQLFFQGIEATTRFWISFQISSSLGSFARTSQLPWIWTKLTTACEEMTIFISFYQVFPTLSPDRWKVTSSPFHVVLFLPKR